MSLHDDDDQLKQLIKDDPTPPLSQSFAQRTLARLLAVTPAAANPVSAVQFSWASLGAHFGRRPASGARPWFWVLAGVVLVWWAQSQYMQSVSDEDLYKIDSVGMVSLLTL